MLCCCARLEALEAQVLRQLPAAVILVVACIVTFAVARCYIGLMLVHCYLLFHSVTTATICNGVQSSEEVGDRATRSQHWEQVSW